MMLLNTTHVSMSIRRAALSCGHSTRASWRLHLAQTRMHSLCRMYSCRGGRCLRVCAVCRAGKRHGSKNMAGSASHRSAVQLGCSTFWLEDTRTLVCTLKASLLGSGP